MLFQVKNVNFVQENFKDGLGGQSELCSAYEVLKNLNKLRRKFLVKTIDKFIDFVR